MSKKTQPEVGNLNLDELRDRLANMRLQLSRKELKNTSIIRVTKRALAKKLTKDSWERIQN